MATSILTDAKKPGVIPGSSIQYAHSSASSSPLAIFAPLAQLPIESHAAHKPQALSNENNKLEQDILPLEAQSKYTSSTVSSSPTTPGAPTSSTSSLPSTSPLPFNSGQALDSTIRSKVEPLFGHNFSSVRVHTDMQAAHTAQSMQARAYTVGSHIFFNRNEYTPHTPQGQHLLAHELTHVVQQSHATPLADSPRSEDQSVQLSSFAQHFATNNAFEREAQHAAATIARGEPITVFQRTSQSWPQREEQQGESSGILDTVANALEDTAWYLIRKYAPDLEPIIHEGIFAWLERHIITAIQGAFDTLMAPVRSVTGFVQELSAHFSELLTWMKSAAEQIKRGDCSAITEATQKIEQVINGFASPIIDKVKELAGKVGSFFKDIWDQFGAPVWDWLKKVGGEAWQTIQKVATSIWDWTEPVRKAGEKAWNWLKKKLGIGDGPDGQNGLLQWIEDKAAEVWNKIKATLEPIKKPLMVIGGILLLLSPAGPFIAIGAAVGGLIVGIRWIRQHLNTSNGVVNARTVLQQVIIPQILGAVKGFTGKLTQIASSVTERLNGVMSGLGNLIGALGTTILKFAVSAIQWIADQFKALVSWASDKLNTLVEWVTTGLERLHTFLQPVLDFLGKIASVIGDILQLPFLIAGQLWNMIPACIRDPFVNFLIQHILSHIPILKNIIAIPNIWEKMKAQAMLIIHQIFKEGNLSGALISIFKLLLTVLQIPIELVTAIFAKAVNAFDLILKDPIGFLKNILGALKQGFLQFFGNIGKHLLAGVAEWFFSQVNDAGGQSAGGTQIHAPRDFSLGSILTFVLEVLDISAEKIFKKLEEKIGPEKVKMLRTARNAIVGAWDWITTLIKEGPGGLWRKLTEKLSDLWHMLLDGIIGWVTKHIIEGAMKYLIGLLIPTGITQIVEGIIGLYKSIQSALKYATKILQIINTVLDSLIGIAQGALGPVATLLENALARGLPIVIGYLANLLDLDDIGDDIKDIVGAIREQVDAAIDWLIDKAISAGSALLEAVGLKEKDDAQDDTASQTNSNITQLPDVTVEENFDLKDQGHTLKAKTQGGNIQITMSSALEGILGSMLIEAEKELERDEARPTGERDELLRIIRQTRAVSDTNKINQDWINTPKQNMDFSQFLDIRLAEIINTIKPLKDFGIRSLSDFFAATPVRRFLPLSYREKGQVRYRLYIRGSQWSQNRDSVYRQGKRDIRALVKEALEQYHQSQGSHREKWDALLESGKIPRSTSINAFTQQDVDKVDYEVDHIVPLSKHWQSEGANSDDNSRWQQSDTANLQLITEERNLEKGGEGAMFDPWVGPDFTSAFAQNNAKGAKVIDGEPFLDAAGNQLG